MTMPQCRSGAAQRGAVLIVSLIMLVVMTLLVVSMIKTSVLELKIGGAHHATALNFSNAELALQNFVTSNDGSFAPNFTPPQGSTTLRVDAGEVRLTSTQIACTDYAGVGSGMQVGGGLQVVFFDVAATATGNSGTTAVHQGIQSLAPPGACGGP